MIGGAGFIGTNLVRTLEGSGHEVLVVDDLSNGAELNLLGLSCELKKISVLDEESLRKSLHKVDSIVHLAALGSIPRSIANPKRTFEVNVIGTHNILDIARDTGAQVIFSSSSSVYGDNLDLPKNEKMWTSPLNPYASSKLSGEGLVQGYANAYLFNAVTLRLFNVFGPWQNPNHVYAAVIPKWINAAINGENVMVEGDGYQTRDFTPVSTVVQTIIECIERNLSHPKPINVAWGNQISLRTLLEILIKKVPNLKVTFGPRRHGDIQHSQNNPNHFIEIFPKLIPPPFEETFDKTFEWLQAHRENY